MAAAEPTIFKLFSLKSSVEKCGSNFDHQATPMATPSPSSPWASLSTRASASLLRPANPRHIYLYNIIHSDKMIQVLDLAAENKTFLDAILAPPILTGVGKTSANIFVDGNNSRVSFL